MRTIQLIAVLALTLTGAAQSAPTPIDTPIIFDEALVQKTLESAKVPDANGNSALDLATPIQIELNEFSFSPNQLQLKLNQPYKFILKNVGKRVHDFVGDNFFKAVAMDSVTFFDSSQTEIGDIAPGYIKDIGLKPGNSAEAIFIPVQLGAFYILCEVPGHEGHGMHGKIELIQ